MSQEIKKEIKEVTLEELKKITGGELEDPIPGYPFFICKKCHYQKSTDKTEGRKCPICGNDDLMWFITNY